MPDGPVDGQVEWHGDEGCGGRDGEIEDLGPQVCAQGERPGEVRCAGQDDGDGSAPSSAEDVCPAEGGGRKDRRIRQLWPVGKGMRDFRLGGKGQGDAGDHPGAGETDDAAGT